jgi:prepilin-type N-terminal cleavage/methylation domain-containing protein
MKIPASKISGFTLIEIAIVLVVLTILLGYTLSMVPVQQEIKQYRQANEEMDRILESLNAFAQANGYLPCPAWSDDITDPTPASDETSFGLECRDNDGTPKNCDGSDPSSEGCDLKLGYLPGKVLGLNGRYSSVHNLLLDPWGKPYLYRVSDVDNNGGGGDFILKGEMKNIVQASGFNALNPDLAICSTDPSSGSEGADSKCSSASQTIFGASSTPCSDPDIHCAPAIVLSLGKDKLGDDSSNSWIQRENLDDDEVFVKSSRSDATGSEYDDIVKWISPNILYSKMIDAGKLP